MGVTFTGTGKELAAGPRSSEGGGGGERERDSERDEVTETGRECGSRSYRQEVRGKNQSLALHRTLVHRCHTRAKVEKAAGIGGRGLYCCGRLRHLTFFFLITFLF